MVPRLTHIALHVDDIDACVEFYRRYCQMQVCHRRRKHDKQIVWMAEPGQESVFVFVIMSHGHQVALPADDYRHIGFAVSSREQVDQLAAMAAADGCLLWPPRDEPFPVGYYCGVRDPSNNPVEFSFGQPLGPGATPLVQE